MIYLVDYPLLMFVIALPALWLATCVGDWVRRFDAKGGHGQVKDFDLVSGAVLSLLALLIGFTFSMAAGRYDQRKNDEAIEANAIGTEYLRVGLLAPADAEPLKATLREYLQQRVLFFEKSGDAFIEAQITRRTDELDTQLWELVRSPASAQPSPITALVASGMNEVLDARGYTQAAIWNRVPRAAWWLMFIIAFWANALIGYGATHPKSWKRLNMVVPLAIAVSFLLIADIDAPQHGLIHLEPRNLTALVPTMQH
jgi:hypothetical protein